MRRRKRRVDEFEEPQEESKRPPASGIAGRVKRVARRHIGWIPPYELRNKVKLGRTVPGLLRFENAEVRRLRPTLPEDRTALVTTIIPTYRRPEHLVRAIESALAQTVDGQPADQFVIVVDDGGGLPDLPDDPRLAAVSLRRNTAVAGVVRNVGIRLARSEFVAFLDDDNLWAPDHLQTALTALRESPAEPDDRHARKARPYGVYTALVRVLPDGTEAGLLSEHFDRRKARVRSFLDTNTFVVRRGRAVRFSRLRRPREVMPREDWELIYRLSRRRRITHIPRPTVRYLVNPDAYFTTWDSALANQTEESGLPT